MVVCYTDAFTAVHNSAVPDRTPVLYRFVLGDTVCKIQLKELRCSTVFDDRLVVISVVDIKLSKLITDNYKPLQAS